MRKKVIITEAQLKAIITHLNENEQYQSIVHGLYMDLKTNYEPALGSVNDGMEYTLKALVTKKVDGEKMSVGALKNYLCAKNNTLSSEFIEQVIIDWFEGRLNDKNYQLSKNVKFG